MLLSWKNFLPQFGGAMPDYYLLLGKGLKAKGEEFLIKYLFSVLLKTKDAFSSALTFCPSPSPLSRVVTIII